MPTMQTSTSIRLEIQKIKNLPPLPVIAQQLLGAINNELIDIDKLVAIIEKDPILTSRILGLANSAFFGFGRTIYTLKEAIINVLGIDMVKSLAMSLVVGGVFDVKKCRSFNITRHWSSALLTADLAMRMANLVGPAIKINKQQLFLYGLLHNFGILILVDRFPKIMNEVFNVAKRHPERRLIYTEQAILDMDHHQAGAWIAEKWQLPSDIVTVIEHHYHEDYRNEYWAEAMLIGYCSRVTREWVLQHDPKATDPVLEQLDIDKTRFNKVADISRSKLDEIKSIAEKMAA